MKRCVGNVAVLQARIPVGHSVHVGALVGARHGNGVFGTR
jgi:hypothetical protein